MKRFTPSLSFVKVHGGVIERERTLSDADVLNSVYDIYLTTYDTLRSEEAFFSEQLVFRECHWISTLVLCVFRLYRPAWRSLSGLNSVHPDGRRQTSH